LPVTVDALQPVLALQVTDPVGSIGFIPFFPNFRPFVNPFAPLIVAVNVTDCPYVEGFRLDATLTLVPAAFTTCPPLSVPVLPALFVSPE
jgi:hypothetical protein